MQKITPFLWFNDQAEEAVKFYASIFKKSKVLNVSHYGEAGEKAAGRPKGSVMVIEFELEGQKFMALNGGPFVKFNEAVSLVVNCKTQAEIDRFCKKLAAPGSSMQCGWLKDKYGVSWQIVPTMLAKMLSSRHPAKTERFMQAMLRMTKFDIKKLKQAYNGKT